MSALQTIEERIAQYLADGTPHGIKGLSDDLIRKGQTPHGIALLWLQQRMNSAALAPLTATAKHSPAPLLPFSQVVFDSIQQGNEQAWTFPFTLRIEAERVDAAQLRSAIETAVEAHPVFAMRIDEQGLQHYEQGYRSPYFSYAIEQREEWLYLHLTANRILGDAASFLIFLQDVCLAYAHQPLAHDAYLDYLQQQEDHKTSAAYIEHRNALKEQFDNLQCPVRPCSEAHADLGTLGMLQVAVPRITSSVLTLAVAEAIMDYCGTDAAALTWAYMGRETAEQQHIFGSLHRDIPLLFARSSATPSQRVAAAQKAIEQGIIRSDYPYTALSQRRDLWANAVNVLVAPPIDLADGSPLQFDIVAPAAPRTAYCMLDVEMEEGAESITLKYSQSHYTEADIQRFAELIKFQLNLLTKELK